MSSIVIEVRDALARLDIQAEEWGPFRLQPIREGMQERFAELDGRRPLWERLRGDAAIQNPDAWQWIASVPLAGRAVLFFDEREEPSGFLFDSGAQVVSVLAESTGFEFYLTDEAMSFLIAFNHHDYLSAVGTAAQWLLALNPGASLRP